MNDTLEDVTPDRSQGRVNVFAAGSIFGAVLASSCCIAPLLLVMFGIGGAWVANLTMLAPYKPYFLAVTTVLLAVSFWLAYRRPAKACTEPNYCGHPMAGRMTKSALWVATLLVLLSATVDLWAPFFY